MSKLTKLLTRPHLYVRDALRNVRAASRIPRLSQAQLGNGRPTAILVGFAAWKTFMTGFLPDHNVVFMGHSSRLSRAQIAAMARYPRPEVFAWSYKFPPALRDLCSLRQIPLTFVEDGFLRSMGLGATRTQPLSLVFDRKAMHFDRSARSELDDLLETYDFDADAALMQQAGRLAEEMRASGLSKYNFSAARPLPPELSGHPERKRVLVLGQVEDDLSMLYGATAPMSGNDLVRMASRENDDAQILYRPHPESLAFSKPHYSKPSEVADICHILGPEYALKDCIAAADIVYTVTSLAGFEAALHDKRVVVLGAPFYSGWGFTEDRDPGVAEKRRLTPEQVLGAAYILYPRYFSPLTGAPAHWSDVLEFLRSAMRAAGTEAE